MIFWLSGVRCISLFGLCEDAPLDGAYNYPHRKIFFCEGNPKQGLVFSQRNNRKKKTDILSIHLPLNGDLCPVHGHSFIHVTDYKNPSH